MSGEIGSRRRTVRSRALILFAAVAGSLAIGIAAIAFTAESLGEVVILEVETVALSPIPTPVPSQKPTPKSPAYPDVSGTAESSTSPPTTSPSVRVAPTSLTIRDLGLSQAVLPVGLDDKGAMEIPNVSDIGWYLHGAAPGMPGATVLVAHVWWGDTPGPFRRLGALDLGASIEVGIGDTIRSYQVVKRTMYDKDELPSDLWRNSGPETLVLITCGGEFDRVTRHYEQNIVVYAVPAQNTTDPQQPT